MKAPKGLPDSVVISLASSITPLLTSPLLALRLIPTGDE